MTFSERTYSLEGGKTEMQINKYSIEVQLEIIDLLIRENRVGQNVSPVAEARMRLFNEIMDYPSRMLPRNAIEYSLRNLSAQATVQTEPVEVVCDIHAWAIALPDEIPTIIDAARRVWLDIDLWESSTRLL